MNRKQLNRNKMKVDAVIFDLDGTILDSIGIYYRIIEIVFKRFDMPMPSKEKLRGAAKTGDFEWELFFPGTQKEKARQIKKARNIISGIYPKLFETHAKLIPKTRETLEWISQKGITIAMVTSTPRQSMTVKRQPLADAGIDDLFKVIITADDAPAKKPAADPLLECGNRLGIPPEHCMYVGDSRTDIQAGKAAGMKTVGVLTGFDLREALSREKPDAVIDSCRDLLEILE